MATKQELLAKLEDARTKLQEYDGIMADIVLSLEEDHNNPLDDNLQSGQSDDTGALYDAASEVEAHINSLP